MWLTLSWKGVELLLYGYTIIDFLPNFWRRIKQNAKKSLEDLQRNLISTETGRIHYDSRGKCAGNLKEYTKVLQTSETEEAEINTIHVPAFGGKLNSLGISQVAGRQQGESISLHRNKEAREYHHSCKEPGKVSNNNYCRRRTVVTEIAKRFEENDFNVKVHTASLSQAVSDVYFEGAKVLKESGSQNSSPKSNALSSYFPHFEPNSKYGGVNDKLLEEKERKVSTNFTSTVTCSTSQSSNSHSNHFENDLNHNGVETSQFGSEKEILRNKNSNRNRTILQGKRGHHSPVTSFEDIFEQQRFSRSLSTYSISDLLKDCPSEADVDEYINNMNK